MRINIFIELFLKRCFCWCVRCFCEWNYRPHFRFCIDF